MSDWQNGIDNLTAAQKITINTMPRFSQYQQKKTNGSDLSGVTVENPEPISDEDRSSIRSSRKININQEVIDLNILINRLSNIDASPSSFTNPEIDSAPSWQENVEMDLIVSKPGSISGLIIHNRSLFESERYLFVFRKEGNVVIIIDKGTWHSTLLLSQSNDELLQPVIDEKSTQLNDTAVNNHLTFLLMDGSRLTVSLDAVEIIESIDLIKGNQHIHRPGKDQNAWNLLGPQIIPDGIDADGAISKGWVLFAGSSGNDWYTDSGILVWGKVNKSNIANPDLRKTGPLRQIGTDQTPYQSQIERSI